MEDIHRSLATYAYNIIGSMEDAKDVVQDVIEKYIGIDKAHIENERNYLIKSTINHAINLKKKKSYQSVYGEWLPEPVGTNEADKKIIQEQTASYTLLVLMEKLNALERAVFILKEGFDYKHKDIADLLDIQTDYSRQLFVRAKKSLQKKPFKARIMDTTVASSYISALMHADIEQLESLLVQDVALMADGGSTAKVVAKNITGVQQTAQLLQNVYGMFLQDKTYFITEINHQAAVVFYKDRVVYNCQILAIHKGMITHFFSIVDPIKLASIKIP